MGSKTGNWLLLTASVVITLLLLEVALRCSGLVTMSPRFGCYDAVVGKVYCAGAEGTFSRGEYSNHLVINSEGMADREYPVIKPDGTLRVALLGDSFTASEYLPEEEKFEGILEAELTESLGSAVEILNFGVSATGTWNQLQIFHLKAAKYRPDVTLLVFFWGNDIRDNIGQLKAGSPNPLLNDYRAPLPRRLMGIRKNFNKALWNHSMLYQLVHDGYGNLAQWVEDRFKPVYIDRINRAIAGVENEPTRNVPHVQALPVTDTEFDDDDLFFWNSAGWELTRKLILKLKAEVEAAGSRFAVLHFPSEGLVTSEYPLPHREFDIFLEENGIPYVSLFQDYATFDREELRKHFIPGEGHWTPHGHRYVAARTKALLLNALTTRP
jgi:hypothetical protein